MQFSVKPSWVTFNEFQGYNKRDYDYYPFSKKDSECIAYIWDDVGRVHLAIKVDDKVIVAEHIPQEYPATFLLFYESEEKYRKEIANIDWIQAGLNEKKEGVKEVCQ